MSEPEYRTGETMTEHLPALVGTYGVEVTPGRYRDDWYVKTPMDVQPIQSLDFVDAMRRFFDGMDREIDAHVDDPIATAQALARMEAIMADMRYVQNRLKSVTGASMAELKIRRITVERVATVEGTANTADRQWNDAGLLRHILDNWKHIDAETGEVVESEQVANLILELAKLSWRSTPMPDHDIDPHDWYERELGDDGKPVKTPTTRMIDNRIKGQR
jgi:hypothetical protein